MSEVILHRRRVMELAAATQRYTQAPKATPIDDRAIAARMIREIRSQWPRDAWTRQEWNQQARRSAHAYLRHVEAFRQATREEAVPA